MRAHLASIDTDLHRENAHRGLDSYPEILLHPLLCQGFADAPYTVLREVGYPSSSMTRPNNAQRQRCDLVFISGRNLRLFDPINEQRVRDNAVGTLFEPIAQAHEPEPDEITPQDAYWVEVKSVAQFSYVDGVPGPNASYTHELLDGPRRDVIKLGSEPLIHHGAVLIMLFSQEQKIGVHDITQTARTMIDHDLPISMPVVESFPITNHASNAWCTLGLIPVRL